MHAKRTNAAAVDGVPPGRGTSGVGTTAGRRTARRGKGEDARGAKTGQKGKREGGKRGKDFVDVICHMIFASVDIVRLFRECVVERVAVRVCVCLVRWKGPTLCQRRRQGVQLASSASAAEACSVEAAWRRAWEAQAVGYIRLTIERAFSRWRMIPKLW